MPRMDTFIAHLLHAVENRMPCLCLSPKYVGMGLSFQPRTKCCGCTEVRTREGLLKRRPFEIKVRKWPLFVAKSHQTRHLERGV